MCAVNLKVDQLEAELQDLNSQESKDEASLAKVSPSRRFTRTPPSSQQEREERPLLNLISFS